MSAPVILRTARAMNIAAPFIKEFFDVNTKMIMITPEDGGNSFRYCNIYFDLSLIKKVVFNKMSFLEGVEDQSLQKRNYIIFDAFIKNVVRELNSLESSYNLASPEDKEYSLYRLCNLRRFARVVVAHALNNNIIDDLLGRHDSKSDDEQAEEENKEFSQHPLIKSLEDYLDFEFPNKLGVFMDLRRSTSQGRGSEDEDFFQDYDALKKSYNYEQDKRDQDFPAPWQREWFFDKIKIRFLPPGIGERYCVLIEDHDNKSAADSSKSKYDEQSGTENNDTDPSPNASSPKKVERRSKESENGL